MGSKTGAYKLSIFLFSCIFTRASKCTPNWSQDNPISQYTQVPWSNMTQTNGTIARFNLVWETLSPPNLNQDMFSNSKLDGT